MGPFSSHHMQFCTGACAVQPRPLHVDRAFLDETKVTLAFSVNRTYDHECVDVHG